MLMLHSNIVDDLRAKQKMLKIAESTVMWSGITHGIPERTIKKIHISDFRYIWKHCPSKVAFDFSRKRKINSVPVC